jgi:hypothetical protein
MMLLYLSSCISPLFSSRDVWSHYVQESRIVLLSMVIHDGPAPGMFLRVLSFGICPVLWGHETGADRTWKEHLKGAIRARMTTRLEVNVRDKERAKLDTPVQVKSSLPCVVLEG